VINITSAQGTIKLQISTLLDTSEPNHTSYKSAGVQTSLVSSPMGGGEA